MDVTYIKHEEIFKPCLRGGLKKLGVAEFSELASKSRISDETLFRVFYMASQSINNSQSN